MRRHTKGLLLLEDLLIRHSGLRHSFSSRQITKRKIKITKERKKEENWSTEETVDHRLERNSPPKPQKPHGGATTLSSISNVTRFYLILRILLIHPEQEDFPFFFF